MPLLLKVSETPPLGEPLGGIIGTDGSGLSLNISNYEILIQIEVDIN